MNKPGNELFGLFLALSAKRAGAVSFAPLATALLSGADVTLEPFPDGGAADTEAAEHTPGTRIRIKRQHGEEVLGAHVAAPCLPGDRGCTPQRLTGLGRLLWRLLAGQTSSTWEQLSRGGAHPLGPHPQLFQHGGGDPLIEKPDQLVMSAHLSGPVRRLPPRAVGGDPGLGLPERRVLHRGERQPVQRQLASGVGAARH